MKLSGYQQNHQKFKKVQFKFNSIHVLKCSYLKILDNHVIEYVPPEVIMTKSNNSRLRSRTKEGRLGMAIVGALSSDPRLVRALTFSVNIR